MSDSISVSIKADNVSKVLSGMLSRAGLARGWLNRVAYPMVVEAQRMRWASEGASEGDSWKRISEPYATRKLKRFASYPGGGRKMLIATGHLVASVTGDETKDHYKLVEDTRLETGTLVGYGKYVNDERNFTKLGPTTVQALTDSLKQYLRGG